MKQKLLLLLAGWLSLSISAQNYQVSTAVQHKNILLEEFTGMYCGYCPEGHAVAAELKSVFRDRISVVAIHTGPFAPADGTINDLTVDDGHAIGQLSKAVEGGFPNGMVNRRDWLHEGKLYFGRNKWTSMAYQVADQKSPVNLWAKAELNGKTRELKIRVEGYYTDNVRGVAPCLNVQLTQNNILAWQSGGYAGNRYPHQHVLREVITPVEGDSLAERKKGEYFVKEYVYQVPKAYKQIPVDPAELELVVSVSQGFRNVLNAVTIRPDYVGEVLPLKAEIRPHLIPVAGGYRYHFVEMEVDNRCNSVLTSATFNVTLNGETSEVEWQGEILPFQVQQIRIPVDWGKKAVASNEFTVGLTGLNGQRVFGNSFFGSFEAPVDVPVEVVLHLNTDEFAGENTYRLYDMDGKCLKTFGPFENGKLNYYEEKLALQPQTTYCIEVTDEKGNGIYPHGNSVELVTMEGTPVMQQYAVKNFGTRLFFTTGMASGIAAAPAVVPSTRMEVYNLVGKLVKVTSTLEGLPKGVYIVRSGKDVRKVILD